MAEDKFRAKIEAAAARKGYTVRWEALVHGARRAVVESTNWEDHNVAFAWARRLRNVHVADWIASSPYHFQGRVYIMDQGEYEAYDAACKAAKAESYAWDERFHAAALIAGNENAGRIAETTASVEEAEQAALAFKNRQ